MSGTQSVLDQMSAGIMDAKRAKTAKLTPVGVETAPKGPLEFTDSPASFPYDKPDVIQKALADALVQIDFVRDGVLALIAAFGQSPYSANTGPSASDIQREKEREADERVRFKQSFAQMQRVAQEATFSAPEDEDRVEPVAVPQPATMLSESGWACPQACQVRPNMVTSRKGRTYAMCPKCGDFER